MRGQMFTLDLFAAYGVFMLMMLFILALSSWLVIGMVQRESTDGMMREAITAADYIVYGPYAAGPYDLDKPAIDALFAKSDDAIADELQLSRNFSIKVIQINGGVVKLEAGAEPTKPEMAIGLERRVRYQSQNAKLVVMLWQA
jgi:hypothetical protein